jgi:spoIIIJ-associated protein
MNDQTLKGKKWLETLLSLMGIPAQVNIGRIELERDQLLSCWLTIDESLLNQEKIDILLGKKGETIDAIQYLANVLLNVYSPEGLHSFYTVELNGYRLRRQAELMAIAQKAATKVRLTGIPEEIRHLSSVERRQIHSILETSPDLYTESQGNEPDRRLIVRLR